MPVEDSKWSGKVLWIGLLLFVLALALRILFLLAIPPESGPFNPYYQGDTPVWLDYASAIQDSRTYDLGLPLRPPGIAYLTAVLWDGQDSGLLRLKLAWSIMGAMVVALLFIAVQRSFNPVAAIFAAFFAAASTGLIILSTSPNNEIPYLLLVIAAFTLWGSIRQDPRLHTLLLWSVLNGLACLIRVEHVLFFALVSVYLVWTWTRPAEQGDAWKPGLARGGIMLVFFIMPLIPWQLHIWSQIEQFNQQPLVTNAATEQAYQQLESLLGGFPWTEEAVREREALPAFCRRPVENFIAATVAMRGESEVSAEDFQIIEEAFGSRPDPISAYPFVSIYGPLNFRLANNSDATGGFTRAPLEAAPPLEGGLSAYPGFLVAGLPPPDLSLTYLPHLEIVNHGYRLGLDWIVENPEEYLTLAARKLANFWSGATLGLTGYNLPLGLSGVRRPVDLVVPEGGAGVAFWRWTGLIVLLAGVWVGRREEALVPWLLLLVTKTAVTLAFFGYAREGAVVIPVIGLLTGLLISRGLDWIKRLFGRFSQPGSLSCCLGVSLVLALLLLTIETYRWSSEPAVTLSGAKQETTATLQGRDHEEIFIQVE